MNINSSLYQAFLRNVDACYSASLSRVTANLIRTPVQRRSMNGKNGKRAIAATLAIVALIALAQPAHAQQVSSRYDRASYVPGDSGTLTVSIVNDLSTSAEIRNFTIFFPWAQLVDGKWPSGANVTVNLSPWKTLGSQGSGTNVYTYSTSFAVPGWYGGSPFGIGGGGNCPNTTAARYGLYSGCILVGITGDTRYEGHDLGIAMALASYTPTSIVAEWLPIATLVVLVVATAFLGLAWMSLRRTAKKA